MNMVAATFSTLASANAFDAAVWDFARTLARVREDMGLGTDDRADLVDYGRGPFIDHARITMPTRWFPPMPHPSNGTFAVRVVPLLVGLVDVNNADTAIANRAKRIRAALISGPTLVRPNDGATIVNSFWTTDTATTTTRWNQMATKIASAAELTDDWFPSLSGQAALAAAKVTP